MGLSQAIMPLVAVLLAAVGICLLLVASSHWHGHLTHDEPGAVQKFHLDPTPRIGGLAIYLALPLARWGHGFDEANVLLMVVLLAGLPALLLGLLEDVTKRVSVLVRLLGTMFSGALACLMSGLALTRLDLGPVDPWLAIGPVALAFTSFAVGGIANSINIVDGFHGLASGLTVIALLALAAIAGTSGDMALTQAILVVAAAVLGFWLVNYPSGRIFLGDGGAYFAGFALAWFAVLLPMRNAAVSPWASLVICGLPFIEAVYSIVRRGLTRRSPGEPDRLHLHSLIATQLIQRHFPDWPINRQNAAVAPGLWLVGGILGGLAWAMRSNTAALMAVLAATGVAYHLCHRRLWRMAASPEGVANPASVGRDSHQHPT